MAIAHCVLAAPVLTAVLYSLGPPDGVTDAELEAARRPRGGDARVEIDGGLLVSASQPVGVYLPLSKGPLKAHWLAMASWAGFDTSEPQFALEVAKRCTRLREAIVVRRRNLLQERYDDLNAAVALDANAPESAQWRPRSAELCGLALREAHRSIDIECNEWRTCVLAAAIAYGQAERINHERLAIIENIMERELKWHVARVGPATLPLQLPVNLDRTPGLPPESEWTPELAAAIHEHRLNVGSALDAVLKGSTEIYMASAGANEASRRPLARQLRRLFTAQVEGTKTIAVRMGAEGSRWKCERLSQFHPQGAPLYEAAAIVATLPEAGLGQAAADAVNSARMAADEIGRTITLAWRDRWIALFEGAEHKGPVPPTEQYETAMRDGARRIAAAVATLVTALSSDAETRPDREARMEALRHLAGTAARLCSRGPSGSLEARAPSSSWPGHISRPAPFDPAESR